MEDHECETCEMIFPYITHRSSIIPTPEIIWLNPPRQRLNKTARTIASERERTTMAEAAISGVTKKAISKPDKANRTIAPKKERRKKEGMVKSKKGMMKRNLSLKENLAAEVVFQVMDEAVSKVCTLKVIDSLAKIGKIQLQQTGHFSIPMFLDMIVSP